MAVMCDLICVHGPPTCVLHCQWCSIASNVNQLLTLMIFDDAIKMHGLCVSNSAEEFHSARLALLHCVTL